MGSQQLAASLCNDISFSMFIFSGNEPNGEPSTSRTDAHDETDFSMASLAKREVTEVHVCVIPSAPKGDNQQWYPLQDSRAANKF